MMTFMNLSHGLIMSMMPPNETGYTLTSEGEPDGISLYLAMAMQAVYVMINPLKVPTTYVN